MINSACFAGYFAVFCSFAAENLRHFLVPNSKIKIVEPSILHFARRRVAMAKRGTLTFDFSAGGLQLLVTGKDC
jgi:hypothetical protein